MIKQKSATNSIPDVLMPILLDNIRLITTETKIDINTIVLYCL